MRCNITKNNSFIINLSRKYFHINSNGGFSVIRSRPEAPPVRRVRIICPHTPFPQIADFHDIAISLSAFGPFKTRSVHSDFYHTLEYQHFSKLMRANDSFSFN